MHFIDQLASRGLLQDISDEEGLRRLAAGAAFYVGFDPTAPSLQLGNLVPIIVSIHLAHAGLKPVILFGGATGAIGDPSGKSRERPLLPREKLDMHIAAQRKKAEEIFSRAGVQVQFVDNYEWTKDLSVIDFLRDVGKHFTVNYMLAKEVVKARLSGEGISYTEFSYMLLQANDFSHLFRSHGCRLQIGGSDQWGNLTAGLELIRKKAQGEAYAFSFPLITDSQGKKFGKSEGGALWLDAAMTSAFRLHQYFLNVADADVIKLLGVFTFLSAEKIGELAQALQANPERRAAQHALADEVCRLVHGEDALAEANKGAAVLFGGDLEGVSEETLSEIFQDVPSTELAAPELAELSFVDLLVKTGLAKSKGEARRLIANGGAYLHGVRISEPGLMMRETPQLQARFFVVRSGKKSYHAVRVTGA